MSKEAPEFAKDTKAFDGNGGGVAKFDWSPSNSVALEGEHKIDTFGYNSKHPHETIQRHIREGRDGR